MTTVLISGLGIAGPTLAYWLRRYGFTPTIVERAPAPRTGGYMIDFWGVGFDVAERMEILPAIMHDGYRIHELRLVDASGRRIGGMDVSVFQAVANGRATSLPRGDLARDIIDRVQNDVEMIFGDSIAQVAEDRRGVIVSFEHAAARRFDLVVGADGLHSNVRRLVFGDVPDLFLGYYAAAFSVDAYPHRDEGVYVSYATPGRQVARYALRDGRSGFLLVFRSEERLAVAPHDVSAQQEAVRRVFAGAGWECDEILAAMDRSDDLYFDAVAQMRMPHWSHGRTALVGDAAYCPSLLAGEGSALGMAGAYILAHALATHRDDHRLAFASYERDFKAFVDAKQKAAAKFAAWFAPATPFRLRLRNLATNAMNLPLIGRMTARRSFADVYELPAAID